MEGQLWGCQGRASRRFRDRRRNPGWTTALLALTAALAQGFAPTAARAQGDVPLTVLTVGGGPHPKMNQVAIESNVRYVNSLLPQSATHRILFADGKGDTANVLYIQPEPPKNDAEAAYRILMEGSRSGAEKFRKPELPQINGPTEHQTLRAELDRISSSKPGPVLLYFTGHGEEARDNNNNFYNLWMGTQNRSSGTQAGKDDEEGTGGRRSREVLLSVRDLARDLKQLPADRPVTLVMVQCYSGSFANLLFEDGDPQKPFINRPLCGFFATTQERPAAGCTPEINEAEYHDFTSYFFAALSGKDRTGKPIEATDYDKNGVIGMDEAFYYALIHEPSVDVPVATSDLFLRRFVRMNDDDISEIPYKKIKEMASPAQRAAMEALSAALGTTSEDRLKDALTDYRARLLETENDTHGGRTTAERDAAGRLMERRAHILERFPALTNAKSYQEYQKIRGEIVAYLEKEPELVAEVVAAGKKVQEIQKEKQADELRGARWLRLFRIAKTVALENKLRQSGDRERIGQFEQLRALESKNPLKS